MKKIVFLVDVDNTLLNNDHVKDEIKKALVRVLGEDETKHFWLHHDEFREEKKLVDFPNIIHQYCAEKHKDTCDLTLGRIFNSIEFSHALYPQVNNVMQHLKTFGKVTLFTEGDSIYQKRKIEQSGLDAMVDDVILYKHKLEHIRELAKKYHKYKIVLIEDKADILVQAKKQVSQLFTIQVLQGHYATMKSKADKVTDMQIQSIEVLLTINF